MRLIVSLVGLAAFLSAIPAHGAVEVFDDARPSSSSRARADSGLTMRSHRRAGVGAVAGGVAGIFGAQLEINFTEAVGIRAGFGTSTDYQSLFLGIKDVLGGSWFLPYLSGGYARWFANGRQRSVGKTTPGFLGERFLSQKERDRGQFTEDLVYGGFGLQYVQLNGDWAGTSVYMEGLVLLNLDGFNAAPTGEMGFMYYF